MFNFNLKNINKFNKIHFIGIGGIGMSGMALLLKKKGFSISGSDLKQTEITNHLKNEGIEIFIGQKKENIDNQDFFIYTDSVPSENEELIAAKSTGKPVIPRGVFLGILMKNYKNAIAISGSHGKSTTTSMISKIFLEANNDATILLGGLLDEMNGNVKIGEDNILLAEACEFKANILNYFPKTAVILNIDADHLEYYKTLENIIDTFAKYIGNLEKDSISIINIDDPNTQKVLNSVNGRLITFSLSNPKADYYISDIKLDNFGYPEFNVHFRDGKVEKFSLSIIGNFNIMNALAAIIVTYENGIDLKYIKSSLKNYKNLHRRLENIGNYNGAIVITDYAHHPVELNSTIKTIKEVYDKNIIAIFEPHLFSRTKLLLDDFSKAFNYADEIIVADIYPAREEFDPTIHSKDLVDKLLENKLNAKYIGDFESIVKYITKKVNSNDIVLTLGAGDTDVLANMIINK